MSFFLQTSAGMLPHKGPITCYINRMFCLINVPLGPSPVCFSLLSLITTGLVSVSDNDLTPMSRLRTTKIFLELVYNMAYCLIVKFSVVK